jgi:LPXTG-site transpeptidase (sortase) family protein
LTKVTRDAKVTPTRKVGVTLVNLFNKAVSATFSNINKKLDTYAKPPKAQVNSILDKTVSAPKSLDLKFFLGRMLVTLGVISLAFLGQLVFVSQTHFTSAQLMSLEKFRYELANGTAPVGQVDSAGMMLAEGTPVALLSITKLNLNLVVLEGTSGTNTMDGLGHKRDTVLPGQKGISVIYGRQAAYSGPFAGLATLEIGDEIKVTTGQGDSTFKVTKLRRDGDTVTNDLGSAAGRLTLVTGEGIPFFPSGVIRVDADLDGAAKSTPSRNIPLGTIPASEQAMAGDFSALSPAIFLAQGLILIFLGFVWLRRNWGRAQAWLVGAPMMLWIGSHFFEQVIRLLPNLL